jgi:hypothetical protein
MTWIVVASPASQDPLMSQCALYGPFADEGEAKDWCAAKTRSPSVIPTVLRIIEVKESSKA